MWYAWQLLSKFNCDLGHAHCYQRIFSFNFNIKPNHVTKFQVHRWSSTWAVTITYTLALFSFRDMAGTGLSASLSFNLILSSITSVWCCDIVPSSPCCLTATGGDLIIPSWKKTWKDYTHPLDGYGTPLLPHFLVFGIVKEELDWADILQEHVDAI